jgi:hypothetical protein
MKNESPVDGIKRAVGLASIIHDIVRIADPEKIFLLSASFDYQLTENIFVKNPVQVFRGSHYNLLVLSEGKQKKSLVELEIMIHTKLSDQGNLQIQLRDIHEFNEKLEAGDEYAGFILLNAMLCYNKGRFPLADPKLREDPKFKA